MTSMARAKKIAAQPKPRDAKTLLISDRWKIDCGSVVCICDDVGPRHDGLLEPIHAGGLGISRQGMVKRS